MEPGRGPAQQFVEKAAVHDDPVTCLEWPYQINSKTGYGVFGYRRDDGKRSTTTAHRAVLILAAGPPPSTGMHAAHRPEICHNLACVNPHHLYWAEPQRNSHDRYADETMFIKDYVTQAHVAEATGLSQGYVSRALSDTTERPADPATQRWVRAVGARLQELQGDGTRGSPQDQRNAATAGPGRVARSAPTGGP